MSLLVSRQATVEEVIQALVKKLPSIPAEVYDRIRLFDARGHREYREFQPTQALSTTSIDTSYGSSFFAEPVPMEEDDAGEHDKFIIIVHFAKDIARLHGVPLKFVMKPVLPHHTMLLIYSGSCGMTRRNDYRKDWDIKIKSLQKSNYTLSQTHTTIQKSVLSKTVTESY